MSRERKEPRLMVKCKVCGVWFFSGIGKKLLKDKSTIIVDEMLACPKNHEAKYSGTNYVKEAFSGSEPPALPVGDAP
jgi:hypothetical protein